MYTNHLFKMQNRFQSVWRGAWASAFLISSQMTLLLLVGGPHFWERGVRSLVHRMRMEPGNYWELFPGACLERPHSHYTDPCLNPPPINVTTRGGIQSFRNSDPQRPLSPPIFSDSVSSSHVSHSHLFLLLIITSLSKHKLQPDKQSTDFSINIDSHEKQKEKGTEWRGVICPIYFQFQTYFFP